MQKKIIALAVAGLVSGAAFAQSNVTIYGIADYGFGYESSKNASFSGIDAGQDSGNRIGFRGEEALGNGLKVVFVHELGIDGDGADNTGKGANFTRKSVIGLSGNFGLVTLGRQNLPGDDYLGAMSADKDYHANGILRGAAVKRVGGIMGDDRFNNMIKYESPNWNGFTTKVAYAFGENNGNKTDLNASDYHLNYNASNEQNSAFGWGVEYNANNLVVGFVYETKLGQTNRDNTGNNDSRTKDTQEFALGASYDFKVVKLGAGWVRSDNKANGARADAYNINAKIPTSTQGRVILEVAQSKLKVKNWGGVILAANEFQDGDLEGFNRDTLADGTSGFDGAKTKAFSVGYEHDLSKRTMFYSSLSYMKNNENGLNKGFKGTGEPDHSTWGATVGLKHAF